MGAFSKACLKGVAGVTLRPFPREPWALGAGARVGTDMASEAATSGSIRGGGGRGAGLDDGSFYFEVGGEAKVSKGSWEEV